MFGQKVPVMFKLEADFAIGLSLFTAILNGSRVVSSCCSGFTPDECDSFGAKLLKGAKL